ncbi:hypothetical protein KI387_036458, partial [Taxus chinensis]
EGGVSVDIGIDVLVNGLAMEATEVEGIDGLTIEDVVVEVVDEVVEDVVEKVVDEMTEEDEVVGV